MGVVKSKIFRQIWGSSLLVFVIGILLALSSLVTPGVGSEKKFWVYHSIDFFVLITGVFLIFISVIRYMRKK